MAESAVRVLTDRSLSRQIGVTASQVVGERFCSERIVPMYEDYYQQVVAQPANLP
jgi:hypothetical protein